MGKKVLIAEDTVDVRDALQGLIEFQGHEVILAENGLEAFNRAREHMPDLILMDIAMPVMTGIEATVQLRADPKTAALPIICITAYDPDSRIKALAAGSTEAFSKSKFISDFDAILKKYLSD